MTHIRARLRKTLSLGLITLFLVGIGVPFIDIALGLRLLPTLTGSQPSLFALLKGSASDAQDQENLRQVLNLRMTNNSIGLLLQGSSPAIYDHWKACYQHPEQIDLYKIPWSLQSRPMPYLNYAPEPGRQPEGDFNSDQMRERREVQRPKPQGTYRIFLVGNSLAYGIGAPDQDHCIANYLEAELNRRKPWPGKRVELFNAAVCGWSSVTERIWIENRLSELEPDMVISLTGAIDVHWGFQGRDIQNMRSYDDEMYFTLINLSMKRAGAQPYPAAPPAISPTPIDPALVARRLAKNARLSAEALAPLSARYLLILEPTLAARYKPIAPGEKLMLRREVPAKVDYLDRCYDAFQKELQTMISDPTRRAPPNLSIINMLDIFKDRTDSIYFDLYHMGDKGSKIVAQRMAEEIQRIVAPAPAVATRQ